VLYSCLYFRAGRSHHEAEELMQEVFQDAWKNLSQFDCGRDYWFWICGISTHSAFFSVRQTREMNDPMAGVSIALQNTRPGSFSNNDPRFPSDCFSSLPSKAQTGRAFGRDRRLESRRLDNLT
jgi:DNA-directed RNA polymerase specialized sigma24 family protein